MTNISLTGTEEDSSVIPFHARRIVGSKTGLVNNLSIYLTQRGETNALITNGNDTDLSRIFGTGEDQLELSNAGKDMDLPQSIMGYIGETAERYCLYYPVPEHEIPYQVSSYDQLENSSDRVVNAEYLRIHTDEQVEECDVIKQFDEESEIGWAGGVQLLDGDLTYIPSPIVSMSPKSIGQAYFQTLSNSNGCACGKNLTHALVNSAYEYIERDAFIRMWYSQEQPDRICLENYPKLEKMKDDLETNSETFHLFEYDTNHSFHVIGCAMESQSDTPPKFHMCGSANLDFESAVEDALIEAAQGVAWIYDVAFRWADKETPREEMLDLTLNVANYLKPSSFDDVRFLVRGNFRTPPPGLEEKFESERAELSAILTALDQMGCTPIGFDLTTDDIAELGMSVGRIYLPELVSLSIPVLPPFGHPTFSDISPSDKPHPYP